MGRLIDAEILAEKVKSLRMTLVGGPRAGKGFFVECMKQYRESILRIIEEQPTVDDAPVVHGKWEWFEEWNPSTTEHPAECEECGWRCSHCKTPLADVVGGYWDDPTEMPELKYCPNCGAKMDLEEV